MTFEESRAHLGVETQRQWSDLAIERSTPCLFGLYSVVVLLGHALHPDGAIPVQQAACYPKTQATERRCACHCPSALLGQFDFSDIGGFPRCLFSLPLRLDSAGAGCLLLIEDCTKSSLQQRSSISFPAKIVQSQAKAS